MKMACPNCGGNIVYIINSEYVYCEHCGQKVEVSRVNVSEFSKYVEEIVEKRKQEIKGTDSYIKKLLESDESQEIPSMKQFVYTCQNCKSEFVHNVNVKNNSCPFCLREGKKRIGEAKGYKVSKIIPFAITRNSISNIICNCIDSYDFTPNNVFATFVPYLVSYDNVEASGYMNGKWNKKKFSVNEKIITFRYIGKSINRNLAERCLDFDFSTIQNFKSAQYSNDIILDNIDSYSRDEAEVKDRIVRSINHDLYVKEDLNAQNVCYEELKIENIKEEVWLLPVYIYKDYCQGKYHTMLINGQNGRIVGKSVSHNDRSVQKSSAFLTFLLILMVLFNKPILDLFFGESAFLIALVGAIVVGVFVYLVRFKTINDFEGKGFAFYGITWNKDIKID